MICRQLPLNFLILSISQHTSQKMCIYWSSKQDTGNLVAFFLLLLLCLANRCDMCSSLKPEAKEVLHPRQL